MKMKLLLSALMVVLLSLCYSNEASAQYGRYHHRGYTGSVYVPRPHVAVIVRPSVKYYRPYPRYRSNDYCPHGHYHCSYRDCYDGYGQGYNRYYKEKRHYNNDGYRSHSYNNGYRRGNGYYNRH